MSGQERAVAVVTGAAGAVGAALAASFAADGYTVHGVDLNPDLDTVMTRIGGVAHRADVTDEGQLGALAALPSVDVLVNAVGAWPLLSFDELTPRRWRRGLEVNLTSAYVVTWTCRSGLRAARGAVVNLTSAIAFKGNPLMVHYTAAKAGLIGLTRSLALALGPDGVRVNAVAPGLLATAGNDDVWTPEQQDAFRATRALRADLHVADVVPAVRHLAGPGAAAVTGQTIVVDGGTVLH